MPVCDPPTSYAVICRPGACDIAAQMSRAFGISVSSSLVKLVPIAVVEVSTIGDSPVTVTVSCSVATCSCWSTVRVWLMTTRMPSRLTVLEPGELEGDVVDARRQREKPEGPVRADDLHLRLNERGTRRRDRDARQHGTGVVGDRAVDAAAEVLRDAASRTPSAERKQVAILRAMAGRHASSIQAGRKGPKESETRGPDFSATAQKPERAYRILYSARRRAVNTAVPDGSPTVKS